VDGSKNVKWSDIMAEILADENKILKLREGHIPCWCLGQVKVNVDFYSALSWSHL